MRQACTLYLSDKAYMGLIKMAHDRGYVAQLPALESRAKGLSNYLLNVVVVNCEPEHWQDTRPRSLQEFTIDELENGVFPTWDSADFRRIRRLAFPNEPITLDTFKEIVCHIAMSYGTIRVSEKFAPGRSLRESQVLSQFFEAFGLGWLTPQNPPAPAEYKHRRRISKHELAW